MGLWAEGLGPLFRAIGPTDPSGNLASVGVIFEGERLAVGWYSGSAPQDPVVQFTEENSPLHSDADCSLKRDWPIWGRGDIPSSELWDWVITKVHLMRTLAEALEERRLSHVAPQALAEISWEFALAVNNSPWSPERKPSIASVLEYIQQIPDDPRTTVSLGEKLYTWHDIDAVRNYLSGLAQDGHATLDDPWPVADLSGPSSSSGLSRFSDERLASRTTAVYDAALKIYQAMVAHWFQPFLARLRMYRLLPVRIEGLLTKREDGWIMVPALTWRPTILPMGQESHADFGLVAMQDRVSDYERDFEEQREAFVRMRRGSPDGVLFQFSSARIDVLSPRSATELAHDWLTEEMRILGWVD